MTPKFTTLGADYSDFFAYINNISGQVLHILGCCDGGGAVLDSKAFEVMSASAAHQNSKYNRHSIPSGNFTSAFINAMKFMKAEYETLTSVQLHAYMISNALDLKPDPLYIQPFFSSDFSNKQPVSSTPSIEIDQENPKGKAKIPEMEAARNLKGRSQAPSLGDLNGRTKGHRGT